MRTSLDLQWSGRDGTAENGEETEAGRATVVWPRSPWPSSLFTPSNDRRRENSSPARGGSGVCREAEPGEQRRLDERVDPGDPPIVDLEHGDPVRDPAALIVSVVDRDGRPAVRSRRRQPELRQRPAAPDLAE